MKVINLYKLVAIILAASLMVACQSTPEEIEDPAETDSAVIDDTTSIGTGGDSGISSSDLGGLDADTLVALQSAATTFYFDYDQASIQSSDRDILQMHATYLSSNKNALIRLEGYADERGTREYNVALGERRANAVMKFLVVNGAGANQVEVISYGEENPADPGHTESAWAKNRRVELSYTSGRP